MKQYLRISLILMLFFTVFLGLVYPYFINRIGYVFFRNKIHGSLIYDKDNNVIGSALIGQSFFSDKYFHSRPSKAGKDGYDAAHSSGSNFGPTSKILQAQVKENAEKYRLVNHLSSDIPLPADAITFSASGLDPDISLENALLQVPRVAQARDMVEEKLRLLVINYAEEKKFNIIGERRINVLKFNRLLDKLTEEHNKRY